MLTAKLRFGFLTTYDDTIFLKLEKDDKSGEVILWHSNVIRGNSCHVEIPYPTTPGPQDYHNKVTLRECFLFCGVQTFKNHAAAVVGVDSKNVHKRSKSHIVGVSKTNFKYISDNRSILPPAMRGLPSLPDDTHQTRQGSPSSKGPSQSRSRQPGQSGVTTRSQESARLADQTSKLSLNNRSPPPR